MLKEDLNTKPILYHTQSNQPGDTGTRWEAYLPGSFKRNLIFRQGLSHCITFGQLEVCTWSGGGQRFGTMAHQLSG